MDAVTRVGWTRRIEDHDPWDAEERLCRLQLLAALDAPGDPFSRSTFAPGHLTASTFCLAPSDGAVLLVWHAWLGGGRWLQPGGHVEPSDLTLESAALRELSEETGVHVEFQGTPNLLDLDVHTVPPHGREPAHTHFDVRFCVLLDRPVAPASPDAAWFAADRVLAKDDLSADDSVRRALRRARGRGWL